MKAADVREYDQADGLESTEGVKRSQSVVSDAAGRIWFSLRSGLSVVDSSQITDDSAPALPQIEAITADNNTANLAASVRIPPSPRRITFEYAGLSLAVPVGFAFDISSKVSTVAGANRSQREKPFTRTLGLAPIDSG